MTHQSARRAALEAAARAAAMQFILRDEISEICNGRITKVMFSALTAMLVDFGVEREKAMIEQCARTAARYGRDAADLRHSIVYQAGDKIAERIRNLLSGEGASEGEEGADGD